MNIMDYINSKNKLNRAKTQSSTVEHTHPLSLTEKQLKEFNWTNFGRRLLQSNLLPATYLAEPQDVDVFIGLDKLPRVQLTFGSDTMKQTKTLLINKSEVSISVDNQLYTESEQMSKIWQEVSGLQPDMDMIGPVM